MRHALAVAVALTFLGGVSLAQPKKAGEAAKKDKKDKGDAPGKSGDAPGQAIGKADEAPSPSPAVDAKAKERPGRQKAQREAAKGKARAALKGEAMHPALKQELRRSAERVARIERIAEVAAEAKDAEAVERAKKLLEKENARHEKFVSNFDPKSGGAK